MKPRILLVGYNGANNKGAEAKLLVSINEIRSVLGTDACITIPSLNEKNLRRYVKEGPNLKIEPVRPSLFFVDIRKQVKRNDLIMRASLQGCVSSFCFSFFNNYWNSQKIYNILSKPLT
jgi:hypothetical protein